MNSLPIVKYLKERTFLIYQLSYDRLKSESNRIVSLTQLMSYSEYNADPKASFFFTILVLLQIVDVSVTSTSLFIHLDLMSW